MKNTTVEPGWHKSSYSGARGDCVEVNEAQPTKILMRDTQHRELGHLGFPSAEWTGFLFTAVQ